MMHDTTNAVSTGLFSATRPSGHPESHAAYLARCPAIAEQENDLLHCPGLPELRVTLHGKVEVARRDAQLRARGQNQLLVLVAHAS
eukprot:1987434-Rhodomonas_salina.3